MAILKQWKKPSRLPRYNISKRARRFSSGKLVRLLLILAFFATVPPIFFHFRLKRISQKQLKKCAWLDDPPLVCAHGGDSSKAFPNTMDAYRIALSSQVDCIEIDVSRSSDGFLFALHDRDLQRLSGNTTAKVGYSSMNEIKKLGAGFGFPQEFPNLGIPLVEDAVELISKSVRQVILDAKVGPPSYETGLAADILSIVNSTQCTNCLIWAKSDSLAKDVIRISQDVTVGYIVMKDPSTGVRSNLLRMKGASVVGVYHPLIDEKLMRIVHGAGKKVYARTVDDLGSMQKMLFEGVDGIVTSHPSHLQQVMQDIKLQCLKNNLALP